MAGTTAVALLCGCQLVSSALPSTEQSEAVAAAYLDAVVAGKCAAAGALATVTYQRQPRLGCDGSRVVSWAPAGEGRRLTENEAIYPVDCVVAGAIGLDDGANGLFVQVLREATGEWRVNGIGSGP